MTPDSIARAALRIMSEHGAEGVTMRAVAAELGVRAPSLYHHVRDKEELLDLVTRLAVRSYQEELAGSVPDEDWHPRTPQQYVELSVKYSLKLRAFYHRHPGLAALLSARPVPYDPPPGSERAGVVRTQIDVITQFGPPYEVARDLYLALSRWTLAAIAFETREQPEAEDAVFLAGLRCMLDGMAAVMREYADT